LHYITKILINQTQALNSAEFNRFFFDFTFPFPKVNEFLEEEFRGCFGNGLKIRLQFAGEELPELARTAPRYFPMPRHRQNSHTNCAEVGTVFILTSARKFRNLGLRIE